MSKPVPRLSRRIADSSLSEPVLRAFQEGLYEVAAACEGPGENELALVRRLVGASLVGVEPAPFEALWPHAQLFLSACIYVAVVDGEYNIEEARIISLMAHRLGLSAGQLARTEAQVFRDLSVRGAQRMAHDREHAALHKLIPYAEDDEVTVAARPDDDLTELS